MGDSSSYIWTAVTGWIPRTDRDLYGYLVTLACALAAQFYSAFSRSGVASGATAIVFTLICSRFFEMSNSLSFLFRIVVRAGSLSACLGAVRDDRDL